MSSDPHIYPGTDSIFTQLEKSPSPSREDIDMTIESTDKPQGLGRIIQIDNERFIVRSVVYP